MTNNYENALVENKNFMLPDMVAGEFTSEDMADDLEGLQISFQRVKNDSFDGLYIIGLLGIISGHLKLQDTAAGDLNSLEAELKTFKVISHILARKVTCDHIGKRKVLVFYQSVFRVVSHNIFISLFLKICLLLVSVTLLCCSFFPTDLWA